MIDTAEDDLLADQGLRFVEAVRRTDGQVDHVHHLGQWHVFHLLAGLLPTANAATDRFGSRLSTMSRLVSGDSSGTV